MKLWQERRWQFPSDNWLVSDFFTKLIKMKKEGLKRYANLLRPSQQFLKKQKNQRLDCFKECIERIKD